MKRNSFTYTVGLEVTFSRDEYELLIEMAQHHYDWACQEAGLAIGEKCNGCVGRINGFLAQMKLSPTNRASATVYWQFRNFDITAKILEQRDLLTIRHRGKTGQRYFELACKLAKDMDEAMRAINAERRKLEGAACA